MWNRWLSHCCPPSKTMLPHPLKIKCTSAAASPKTCSVSIALEKAPRLPGLPQDKSHIMKNSGYLQAVAHARRRHLGAWASGEVGGFGLLAATNACGMLRAGVHVCDRARDDFGPNRVRWATIVEVGREQHNRNRKKANQAKVPERQPGSRWISLRDQRFISTICMRSYQKKVQGRGAVVEQTNTH